MFSTKSFVRALPLVRQVVQQNRQMSVISGPPRVRVNTVEKIVHGAVIFTAMFSIPVWVLVNIKNYKHHD